VPVTMRLIFFVLAMAFAAPAAHLSAAQVCEGCPVKKLRTTRIRDGKWRRDIALGKGISVQDAELIVRSVRRSTISDKADAREKKWPAIDAETLTQINVSEWVDVITSKPWSYVRQAGARYFDVIEYSGRITVVGLIDGRLERVESITIDP